MGDFNRAVAQRAVADALADAGDRRGLAAAELLPVVYDLLRRRARQLMGHERGGHTLSPTGLVHEAYLRVADRSNGFESRRHFYNVAAQAMRRILVDHARSRGRAKRGDGAAATSLDSSEVDEVVGSEAGPGLDWLALDEALEALASHDPRRHQVIVLRFFAGLDVAEVAALLGMDERTVRRDWVVARLWLLTRLSGAGA